MTVGLVGVIGASLGLSLPAFARSGVRPERARPGDPLAVTVSAASNAAADADHAPSVTVGTSTRRLLMWPIRGGWQGVGAVPEDTQPGAIAVKSDADLDSSVLVRQREVRQADVQVPDRYVHPTPEDERWNAEDHEILGRAFAHPAQEPLFSRAFVWPRAGKVTSGFGEQRRFNDTLDSVHEGVDLLAPVGAPVRAANDGVVVLRRDCFNSGQTIFVDHGGGIFTGYFHLSDMQVDEGQRVRRGQRIGKVGNTGRSSAPHLHFAVRADGRYVDPQAFMKLRLQRPLAPVVAAQASAR